MSATGDSGRGRVGKGVLLGLGLAGGALLAELSARGLIPDADNHGPPAIFASASVIPFTTRPNAEHIGIRHPFGDYVYSVHLDANGFRRSGQSDDAIDLSGRGTLVLGDSFAFGMGVDDAETMEARLGASELRATCASPVVNGGWIAGNNPATAAVWLANQPASRRPLVVLHLVFPVNDVDDTIPLRVERDGNGDLVRVSEDVAYVDTTGHRRYADKAGLRTARDWLRAHFRLYQPAYRLLALALPGTLAEQRTPQRDLDAARNLAVDALRQSARWADARGTRSIVVFVPSAEEVEAATWRPDSGKFIAAVIAAGLEAVDLLEGHPRLTRAHYFRTDAHWTPEGHSVVAAQLLPRLNDIVRQGCRRGRK